MHATPSRSETLDAGTEGGVLSNLPVDTRSRCFSLPCGGSVDEERAVMASGQDERGGGTDPDGAANAAVARELAAMMQVWRSGSLGELLDTISRSGDAAAITEVVTQLAKAYTRGRGFGAGGRPNADVNAAISTAVARLMAGVGDRPGSVSTHFSWSPAEQQLLDQYRAQRR